ncbi:hypothetical protein F5Y06DRAFT_307671 [Hypoxylon sp. FL0890]|nr:hypothetical protein F5Y06DRAFT_307671 [Hypoxylon sp. FL0890]
MAAETDVSKVRATLGQVLVDSINTLSDSKLISLRREVDELRDQASKSRCETEQNKEENTKRIDLLASKLKQIEARLNASYARESRPKPYLPEPPILNKPEYVESWNFQMRGKLTFDGDTLGSPELQFHYVFAHLNPDAQEIVSSYLKLDANNKNWDCERIFDCLRTEYDDDY